MNTFDIKSIKDAIDSKNPFLLHQLIKRPKDLSIMNDFKTEIMTAYVDSINWALSQGYQERYHIKEIVVELGWVNKEDADSGPPQWVIEKYSLPPRVGSVSMGWT